MQMTDLDIWKTLNNYKAAFITRPIFVNVKN